MLKKIITVSILSVSALAVMTANAATTPSDTSNATNAKKNNKPIQAAPLRKSKPAVTVLGENNEPLAQTISFESKGGLPAGLYVSGQIGYADTHMKSTLSNTNFLPGGNFGIGLANDGLAGRLAMGYKINQNFAVEVGYLQLQKAKSDLEGINASNTQNALDIAGKGIIPLTHNVNAYAKVGVAYLTTKLQGKFDQAGIPITADANSALGIAKHKWAPEVAVGMGYDITPNVTVDTSFTHINPMGSNSPGNIDFLAVGVGYNFG